MFQINEIVDNTYQILREIGRGGTGIVFLAFHLRLEKYVVVKKIKDNFVDIVNVRAEVDILKKLHHKYLPQVYDFVQSGSDVYTVIDYIEGYDLEYYMSIGYQFTEEEIVKWMQQMCEVLDYLHSQKQIILHSDIKPSNIMIDSDGNICLIDFNISLNNQQGADISGLSPYYASPEQVEKAVAFMGKNNPNNVYCDYYQNISLDARMDIYSMGATFYYIVSGIRPYINLDEFKNFIIYGYSNGWDFANTFPMGVEEKAQNLNVPYSYGLLSVIDKAMELNINNRYQSASSMLKALTSLRKREKGYRLLLLARYSSIVLYGIVLSIGILLCINGANDIKISSFEREISGFYSMYNEGNGSAAISKGIGILNNENYFSMLEDDKEEKANILHTIGDCYYYNEQYEAAIPYYEEAYKYMQTSDDEIYCRDYAIALVKADHGYISKAKELINNSVYADSVGLKVVEAQICFEEGSFAQADEIASAIINQSDATTSDKVKAYAIKAEIAENSGDVKLCIDMREEAYSLDSNDRANARKLARKYIEYMQKFSKTDESFKKPYYRKACDIYESLMGKGYSTIEDKINLSKIYVLINESDSLKKAEKLMIEELETNGNDYRVSLQLSYIYRALKDESKAKTYCRDALQKYNQSLDVNNEDYEQIYSLKNEMGV